MIKTISSEIKTISDNAENHPQFLKFQRLLDQYLEITNEEKRQRKFVELVEQGQRLEKLGIFPSWEMQN